MINCLYVSPIFPPQKKDVQSLGEIEKILGCYNDSVYLFRFSDPVFKDIGIVANEQKIGLPKNKFGFVGDFLFVGIKETNGKLYLKNLNDSQRFSLHMILLEYKKMERMIEQEYVGKFTKHEFELE